MIRQPLSLLPSDLKEFINNTKNSAARQERLAAYTSLFCGLKAFYDIDDCSVRKDEDGKPHLVNKSDEEYIKDGKKINISISHSEGVSAVCISDEGRVGIDIQAEIEIVRTEKLKKRFFADVTPRSENVGVEFYLCDIKNDELIFEKVDLHNSSGNDFTTKWAYAESLMKLSGRGFGDLGDLKDIEKTSKTQIKTFLSEKAYNIVISAEKRLL